MKFSSELNDKKAGGVLFLPSDLPRFYHQFYSLLLSVLFVWEQLAYQNMFTNVPAIINSTTETNFFKTHIISDIINTQFLEQIQLMRWSLGLMMGLDCYNLEFRIPVNTKSFSLNDVFQSIFCTLHTSTKIKEFIPIFNSSPILTSQQVCTLQQRTKSLFQFLILRLS